MDCRPDYEAEVPTGPSQAAVQKSLLHPCEPEEPNEFVDPSIYNRRGIFLQFINTNCIGATTIIGGMRLNLADIQRIPVYLTKHREAIKTHAMHLLMRHFMNSQCANGVGEVLTTQDFSMTFSIASISPRAAALNPMGRSEGPVFYAACPAWTEEVFVGEEEDGAQDTAHVVNVYVYLPDANRRRHLAIKRLNEERNRAEITDISGQPSKKQRFNNGNNTNHRRPFDNRLMIQQENTLGEIKSVQETVSTLAQEVRQLRLPAYPRLPEKSSLNWPVTDRLPELPDDI